MALKELEYFEDVDTPDQIEEATQANDDVKKYVAVSLKIYSVINVSQAMEQLANVSGLLKLANAASKGYDCNVPIISILGKYQSMINDTTVTTDDFVKKCIEALGYYSIALDQVEEKKFEASYKTLSKAADLAKDMADKCGELVEKAKELVDLSLDALEKASKDEVEETKKLKEAIKKMDELTAESERLKTEIEGLVEQIAEMKELGDKAAEDAREDRRMANIMRIVGAIAEPLASMAGSAIAAYTGSPVIGRVRSLINQGKTGKTEDEQNEDDPKDNAATKVTKKQKRLKKQEKEKKEELEKKEEEEEELEKKEKDGTITDEEKEKKSKLKGEIENLKKAISDLGSNIANVANEIAKEMKESADKAADKEVEYRKLKNQYQDLKRTANSDLAKNLSTLKSLDLEKGNLKVGIQSLNIVINAMGKVKTIFENTKMFWESVQKHCLQLKNLSKLESISELIKDSSKEKYVIQFKNEIKKSGISWLTLGKINLEAFEAVSKVKKETDKTMSNLPNKEQAKAIVKEVTDEMDKKISDENAEIERVKKAIEDENKAAKPTA